ncbi:MAG: helix-turn-helix transcriptional regulator [Actinomycetota bacterium]|jgi:DNA-binding Xre family transcriptional regulator|nr:helix-turn-helix transcriptional regulator [Actinomycetota bacterium]
MRWNLRMVAAERGVWRSTDLRRALGDAGLEMSAGKMSNLWSGTPISIRLDDLEVICSVLGCGPGDLLVQEPHVAPREVVAPRPPGSDVRPARRARNERSVPPA